MKIKIIGSIIGIIQFVIILFIIVNVYKGSFRSVSMVILLLIIFQATFYNRLSSKNRKAFIQKIVIINLIFIIVSFALLPRYTYDEAKTIVENKYKNELNYLLSLNHMTLILYQFNLML